MNERTEYFYLNGQNQPVGPLSRTEIVRMAQGQILAWETLVCPAGGDEWAALSSLAAPTDILPPAPIPASSHQKASPVPSSHIRRIVAMALGILSIPMACVPVVSLLPAIAGLTMGIVGWRKGKNNTLALTAIVTSSIGLVLGLACSLLMVAGISEPYSTAPATESRTNAREARMITTVLEQWVAICEHVPAQYDEDLAGATGYVAQQLQTVDVSGCPPDFRAAYQDHLNAWKQAQPYFAAANTPFTSFLEGFYGGYTGDWSVIGMSERQSRAAAENIFNTYGRMVMIAANHGARVPNPVNR